MFSYSVRCRKLTVILVSMENISCSRVCRKKWESWGLNVCLLIPKSVFFPPPPFPRLRSICTVSSWHWNLLSFLSATVIGTWFWSPKVHVQDNKNWVLEWKWLHQFLKAHNESSTYSFSRFHLKSVGKWRFISWDYLHHEA